MAKRASLEAPLLLKKGSLTCKSETDCRNILSPVKRKQANNVKSMNIENKRPNQHCVWHTHVRKELITNKDCGPDKD